MVDCIHIWRVQAFCSWNPAAAYLLQEALFSESPDMQSDIIFNSYQTSFDLYKHVMFSIDILYIIYDMCLFCVHMYTVYTFLWYNNYIQTIFKPMISYHQEPTFRQQQRTDRWTKPWQIIGRPWRSLALGSSKHQGPLAGDSCWWPLKLFFLLEESTRKKIVFHANTLHVGWLKLFFDLLEESTSIVILSENDEGVSWKSPKRNA